MTGAVCLLAQSEAPSPVTAEALLLSPLIWALAAGALGLWLLIIGGSKGIRRVGAALGVIGLVILGSQLPRVHDASWPAWTQQITFWLLAGMAVISAAAVIVVRSPIYSAVWFAITLLSVSGLLFVQGAQFLGIATMAVYAGAILVTFLFVIMLAQPEGFAFYDRLSWGHTPTAVAIAASLTLAAGAAYLIVGQQPFDGGPRQGGLRPSLREQLVEELPAEPTGAAVLTREHLLAARFIRPEGAEKDILLLDATPADHLRSAAEVRRWSQRAAAQLAPLAAKKLQREQQSFTVMVVTGENVRAPQHVARLGGHLFSRHLISIQAAGALLLAALVGAVAIAISGRDPAQGKREVADV